jgi:hypothetical protein
MVDLKSVHLVVNETDHEWYFRDSVLAELPRLIASGVDVTISLSGPVDEVIWPV